MHLPSAGSQQSGEVRFSTLLYTLLMESALQTLHPAQLQTLLREFENIKSNLDADGDILSEDAQTTFEGTPLHAFSSAGWSSADAAAASKFWHELARHIRPALGLRSTLPHLLINGRVGRSRLNMS
jgi:UDP-glucose:glycoprotein glucosyltransferase